MYKETLSFEHLEPPQVHGLSQSAAWKPAEATQLRTSFWARSSVFSDHPQNSYHVQGTVFAFREFYT